MDDRRGFAAVFSILILLCGFMLGIFVYGKFSTGISADEPATVHVRRGESVTALARRLGREGVLRQPEFFRILAILRGDSHRLQAGEYVVQGDISPSDLIDYFVAGDGQFHRLTIPEGFSLKDIAAKLEQEGKGDAKRFMHLATDAAFIATLELPFELPRATMEGLAFPETYYFSFGTGEAELIRMMVREFVKQAYPILRSKARQAGMTGYEALTLASIIEKETGADHERIVISAVFHNRLKSKMRLSSDPTVIYGIEAFNGNLTRRHLRTDSPYNTYRNFGLPPTPIANPGLASLEAALKPAAVDYLYFVSKGDGTHQFSSTYKAHAKAVWRYQKLPHRKQKS